MELANLQYSGYLEYSNQISNQFSNQLYAPWPNLENVFYSQNIFEEVKMVLNKTEKICYIVLYIMLKALESYYYYYPNSVWV